jgi:hypothetical protein
VIIFNIIINNIIIIHDHITSHEDKVSGIVVYYIIIINVNENHCYPYDYVFDCAPWAGPGTNASNSARGCRCLAALGSRCLAQQRERPAPSWKTSSKCSEPTTMVSRNKGVCFFVMYNSVYALIKIFILLHLIWIYSTKDLSQCCCFIMG